MLFLLMADVSRRVMVLTERDIYDLCLRERDAGRVPTSIEFMHAPLPGDLCDRLTAARRLSSEEVTPGRGDSDDAALRERIREATPSNESLLRMANTHRPPPAWWDEDADPFTPQEGP